MIPVPPPASPFRSRFSRFSHLNVQLSTSLLHLISLKQVGCFLGQLMATLPETNGKFTPKNRPVYPIGKEKVFLCHPFSGANWLLVSGRVIGALGRLVVWDSNRVPLSNSPFHFRGSQESINHLINKPLAKLTGPKG